MLPKKRSFIQEVVEPEKATPEFIQEVVEPEVHIPEEPELLTENKRVIIKARRNTDA